MLLPNVNVISVQTVTVTVTVTEALVLRPLLEDRGCITESIHILVPVNRIKQKCFQITTCWFIMGLRRPHNG